MLVACNIAAHIFLYFAESENKPDEEIGPKIDEKTETIEDSAPAEVTQNKSTEIETTKKPVPKIREWDRGKESMYLIFCVCAGLFKKK